MSKKKSEDMSTGSLLSRERTWSVAKAIQQLTYRELMDVALSMASMLSDLGYECSEENMASVLDSWSWGQTEEA